jgi:TRAP-type C4-dicarboxylate transport system substrate-binding protein
MIRLVATLCTALLLPACGSKSPDDGGRETRRPRNEVRVATHGLPGSVDERNWQRFVANVEVWAPEFRLELLTVEGDGASTVGDPLEEARSGRIQIASLTLAEAAAAVPEVAILSVPYLFDSPEEADYVLDEVLLEPFRRLFAERDLRLLQWVDVGWTQLYSREPWLEPGQVAGARLAAAPSLASQAFVASLSAELVPAPAAPGLLSGLEAGTIDGGVATVVAYAARGLAREAPHCTLTRHAFEVRVLVAHRPWFHDLTPHDKGVFEEAFGSAGQARADTRGAAAATVARLEAEGVRVHRLSPDQRRTWATASSEAQPGIIAQAGGRAQEIHDLVLAGKAAFAAREQPGSSD